MDSFLSDSDIVKALKRCSDPNGMCKNCPLDKTPGCQENLMRMAASRLHDVSAELGKLKKKPWKQREQELLDHIAELHSEIVRYESYMDWGDEDLGEFPHLLPKE